MIQRVIRNSLREVKNRKTPCKNAIVIKAAKLGGETVLKRMKALHILCVENGIIIKP